jgi:hypothetical protein
MRTSTSLFQPPTPGHFIYKLKNKGDDKFVAQRRWGKGLVKSAIFYSIQEATDWLLLLNKAGLREHDLPVNRV